MLKSLFIVISLAILSAGPGLLLAQVAVEDVLNGSTQTAAGHGENSGACSWECLKWGKVCNIDPRGVYKCRRVCENFGERCAQAVPE